MTVPSPLPVWFVPLMRHMSGLEPRPADCPKPAPAWALDQHAELATWYAWRRDPRRPKPLRPAVWRTVPLWAWHLEGDLLAKAGAPTRTPPVVVPPSTARSPWKSPIWLKRGMQVTWGFATKEFTPEALAQKLHQAGYGWASLEGYPAVPSPFNLDNGPFHDAFRDALHALGLGYGIWERSDQEHPVADAVAIINAHKPDFYGADIETFPIADLTFPSVIASTFPSLPRCVLIAGMPVASEVAGWISSGFDCGTQAYSGPDPQQTAGSMDSDAKWRGWPINASGHYSWPILEIHSDRSKGLRDQLPDIAPWGSSYSVYAAELMQADDWTVAA